MIHAHSGFQAGLLAGTRIALLALGDSNYSSFMQMPRRLHTQLKELGAVDFMPRVEADDATPTGLESVVEPWFDKLWTALKGLLLTPSGGAAASKPAEEEKSLVQHPRLPMIGFDVAHPCLTFDKWRVLPLLNADFDVVDLVQTYF